jgi:hypothetical protein
MRQRVIEEMHNNSWFVRMMRLYNPDAFDKKMKVMYQGVLQEMNNDKKFLGLMIKMNSDGYYKKMRKEGKFSSSMAGVMYPRMKEKILTRPQRMWRFLTVWTDKEILAFMDKLAIVSSVINVLVVLICLVHYSDKILPSEVYLKCVSKVVYDNYPLITVVCLRLAYLCVPAVLYKKDEKLVDPTTSKPTDLITIVIEPVTPEPTTPEYVV